MASKEQEKLVHKSLSTLLRQLYELEATAGDFTQPNSQEVLLRRLQEFTEGLEQFKQLAAMYNTIQVPTALLKFIDGGGHPDDFVRTTFRAAVADNQLAAGRVAALHAMEQQLTSAAAANFPADAAVYTELVATKQQELRQEELQLQQERDKQAPPAAGAGQQAATGPS